MFNFTSAQNYEAAARVAQLPETNIRLQAAYYDMMDEAFRVCPSACEDWPQSEFRVNIMGTDYEYKNKPSVYTNMHWNAEFDEVMNVANDCNTDSVIWTQVRAWERQGVAVYAELRITAPMDPDYYATLKSLGKIRISEGYTQPPSAHIFCPTSR